MRFYKLCVVKAHSQFSIHLKYVCNLLIWNRENVIEVLKSIAFYMHQWQHSSSILVIGSLEFCQFTVMDIDLCDLMCNNHDTKIVYVIKKRRRRWWRWWWWEEEKIKGGTKQKRMKKACVEWLHQIIECTVKLSIAFVYIKHFSCVSEMYIERVCNATEMKIVCNDVCLCRCVCVYVCCLHV